MKPNLLSESIADTVIVYLIIKKLSTPYEEWDAYKLGIIDKEGNKIKTPISSKERAAYTVFDRFILNMKKILQKFVGKSRIAAMLTAAYLLRENFRKPFNNGELDKYFEEELKGLTYIKIKELHDTYGSISLPLYEEKLTDEHYIVLNKRHFETLNVDFEKLFDLGV